MYHIASFKMNHNGIFSCTINSKITIMNHNYHYRLDFNYNLFLLNQNRIIENPLFVSHISLNKVNDNDIEAPVVSVIIPHLSLENLENKKMFLENCKHSMYVKNLECKEAEFFAEELRLELMKFSLKKFKHDFFMNLGIIVM